MKKDMDDELNRLFSENILKWKLQRTFFGSQNLFCFLKNVVKKDVDDELNRLFQTTF